MGNIFVRPVFSDPRQNQRAAMFFNTVWTNFVVVSVFSAITAMIQTGRIYSISLPAQIFITILTVAPLELSRRGRTTIACWCYIVCCITYVSGRAYYLGGIHSAPLMTLYCAVASMAGVLLGVEAGMSVALGCLGIGLGFVILEMNGLLPKPAFHYNPLTIWLSDVIYMTMVMFLIRIARRTLQDTNAQLTNELAERKRTERHLEKALQEGIAAREQADDANRAKSDFLANMSHDLRTPLNAILGFSELTRDAVMGELDSRYREYAGHIHDSGSFLLHLVNEILDLSKLEAGRFELYEDEFDPIEIMDDSIRMVEMQAQKRTIALTTAIAPRLSSLRADPLRLKQIVVNLLSNAVKFTPEGGKVTLLAGERSGGLVIEVCDTGIGMSPGQIEKALEPFGQIENSSNRKYSGTGLGLPIAKRLAELHGGALTIDSTPARGTRVTILMPPSRVLKPRPQPAIALA